MPDAIDLVSLSGDDTLGPHNLFWQHTAGCIIDFPTPSTPRILGGWNGISVQQIAGPTLGLYLVTVEPFDVPPLGLGFPRPMIVHATMQSARALVCTIANNSASAVIVAIKLSNTGAGVDPDATEHLHLLVTGRRSLVSGKRRTIRSMHYNMGIAGWDGKSIEPA